MSSNADAPRGEELPAEVAAMKPEEQAAHPEGSGEGPGDEPTLTFGSYLDPDRLEVDWEADSALGGMSYPYPDPQTHNRHLPARTSSTPASTAAAAAAAAADVATGTATATGTKEEQQLTAGPPEGSSSTMSLSSSLYENVEENGRTYHRYKEGKYPLPNDELEQDRLNFQHMIYKLSLDGKLYAAPIPENPKHVLDVATGTGIWAIEFAQEHPGTQVIGTDLSPIQPSFAPPNVSFEISDAEDEWSFSAPFDLVHMRAVLTCFRDPRAVFAQAYAALAPGGYLQLRDPVFPFKFHTPPPEDCALAEWNSLLLEASARVGRRWDNAQHYAGWLRELGFVDVVEHREVAPLNPWTRSRRMKYLSLWLQHDMLQAVDSISLALFTRVLGWEVPRLTEFLARVKKDICDTSIHVYSEGVLVWGRKPFDNEVVPQPAA